MKKTCDNLTDANVMIKDETINKWYINYNLINNKTNNHHNNF